MGTLCLPTYTFHQKSHLRPWILMSFLHPPKFKFLFPLYLLIYQVLKSVYMYIGKFSPLQLSCIWGFFCGPQIFTNGLMKTSGQIFVLLVTPFFFFFFFFRDKKLELTHSWLPRFRLISLACEVLNQYICIYINYISYIPFLSWLVRWVLLLSKIIINFSLKSF